MKKDNFEKKILKDKIALMIRNQQLDESLLKNMSFQQLMEEVNIYHQELIYQNDELSQRSLELEAEKTRYRDLFEDSPVGYLILDRDFVIQSANKTFSRFFNVSSYELMGKPITAMVQPESQDELYFSLQETNRNSQSEARIVKLTTGIDPLVTNLTCNVYEHRGQTLIRAAFVDITTEYNQRNQAERQLKAKNEQYELAIMGSNAGIWDWDIKTDRVEFSQLFRLALGYNNLEMPNFNSLLTADLFHPDDKEVALRALNDYLEGKCVKFSTELRILHKNGSYRWFIIRGAAFRDSKGEPYRVIGSAYDINEQKELEEALKRSEEKYRLIAENISDVISVFNISRNCYTFFSPSVEELTGYSADDAMALSFREILNPEDADKIAEMIAEIQDEFSKNHAIPFKKVFEFQIKHKNGKHIWVETSAKARLNHQGELEVLGVIRDIVKRKEAELEIEYLIYHDKLTGLFNRHYFDQRVVEEMARADRYGEPLSMVTFDLDHFKKVNDTWGHPVGDAVLKRSAEIVQTMIRKTDVLARFGGEEFVILMPETTQDGAYLAAEKIRQALENTVHPIAGAVTVSLGIAQRLPYESFISLYKRLDDALYEAKGSGRNRSCLADNVFTAVPTVDYEWVSDWDSGDPELDNQHKDLLKMANSLIKMSLSSSDLLKDISVLYTAVENITAHFRYEEKLLHTMDYPDYDTHCEIHKTLIDKAANLIVSLENGKVLTSDILSFVLDEVIIGHMLRDDVKFFPYMRRAENPSLLP